MYLNIWTFLTQSEGHIATQIVAVLDANIESLSISRSVPPCQKMFSVVQTKLLHYFLQDSFILLWSLRGFHRKEMSSSAVHSRLLFDLPPSNFFAKQKYIQIQKLLFSWHFLFHHFCVTEFGKFSYFYVIYAFILFP